MTFGDGGVGSFYIYGKFVFIAQIGVIIEPIIALGKINIVIKFIIIVSKLRLIPVLFI